MQLKSQLPNLLTLANLASGMLIIISAFKNQYSLVLVYASFCLIFDFLDGFVARLLNVKSYIGKELDSLADAVSFGVAPSLVLFNYYHHKGLESHWSFICLLIALFAIYRLAKFNVSTQSDTYFQGLPTPAFSVACFAIPLGSEQISSNILTQPIFIALFVLIGGYLMISDHKLLTLKFSFKEKKMNKVRVALLATCLVLILWLKFLGVFLCLPAYLAFSLASQKQLK